MRASGVRSSCETAAVNPARSSWYAESSGSASRNRTSGPGAAPSASSPSRLPGVASPRSRRRGGARRDETALAVEHDNRIVDGREERSDAIFGTIHHTFTNHSPLEHPWTLLSNR